MTNAEGAKDHDLDNSEWGEEREYEGEEQGEDIPSLQSSQVGEWLGAEAAIQAATKEGSCT